MRDQCIPGSSPGACCPMSDPKKASYSNEELVDAVERIRKLNGQPPVHYRGNRGHTMVFRDDNKKEIYYSVGQIVHFIEQVRALDGFTAEAIRLPITKH